MAKFVLNVNDIDEAGKDFSFSVSRAWLVEALDGTGVMGRGEQEGRFELHAHKQGADVVIQGSLEAELVTECSRCLDDARISVRTRVTSLLTARGADLRDPAGVQDLTPEDLDRETYSGDRIELDAIVREHLLLEVPIQPLCRTECEGIEVPASVAGPADLARSLTPSGIDPRLAPLMKLVDKVEPNEE